MKQTLTIWTSPKQPSETVRIRKTHLGRRLFQNFFGSTQQVTILVPGNGVTSLEIKEEENKNEPDKTVTSYE